MQFFFCASARDEIYEISLKLWKQRQTYYAKRIEASKKYQLSFVNILLRGKNESESGSQNTNDLHFVCRTLINHLGWTLDTTILNSKMYQEEQQYLTQLWAKYFEKNGQETVILTRKLSGLLRQGICDVFRGSN
jgi:hypothetical protein